MICMYARSRVSRVGSEAGFMDCQRGCGCGCGCGCGQCAVSCSALVRQGKARQGQRQRGRYRVLGIIIGQLGTGAQGGKGWMEGGLSDIILCTQ